MTHCVEGPLTRDPLLGHRLPAVTAVCRGLGYWERWMWQQAAFKAGGLVYEARNPCEQLQPECGIHPSTPDRRYVGAWCAGMFIYGCGCMAVYVQNCLEWGSLDRGKMTCQDSFRA
jgi:hypothetical protein